MILYKLLLRDYINIFCIVSSVLDLRYLPTNSSSICVLGPCVCFGFFSYLFQDMLSILQLPRIRGAKDICESP